MLDFKIKFMNSGLTKDQMNEKEQANTKIIAEKILLNLRSEALDQTKNQAIKCINEFSL